MRSNPPPLPIALPRPSAPVPAVVATAANGYAKAAELSGVAGQAPTSDGIRGATQKSQGDAAMQAGFKKAGEATLQVFF